MMFNGYTVPTAEHAFQLSKTTDHTMAQRIADAPDAKMAKMVGRAVPLRRDWEDIKLGVMLDIVRTKFSANPSLGLMLGDTGEQHLEEGNTWGDKVWGTVNGHGQNLLGLILMQVRRERLDGARRLLGEEE